MKYTIQYSLLIILCIQHSYANESERPTEKLQALDTSNNRIYVFDSRALFGSKNQNIDLESFKRSNGVQAGVYSLNTNINNNRRLGELNLKFDHLDASSTAVLCIDQQLLQRLDLRPEVLLKLPQKKCLTIKELSPDAYYDLDTSALTLNLSLPLSIINQRPYDYIAPELFSKGVTAAYISYDFNSYTSKLDEQDDITNHYLSLTGGLNFGAFNFRHAGSFDSDGESLGSYRSYLNALSTDILALKSRLTAGDFNTQTYAIDSANIRGLQLASDISMYPMSQRSYAPQIRGVANTNALVSVFQNGRKIFERTVPAGEFELNDLTAIGNNGDLTVQVTENGGQQHSFIVPMQGNMNLVRVGQLNYSIASGQYKFNSKTSDEYMGQLSAQYGLTNYISLYGGSNISQPFKSYLLGLGANMLLGGVRFDVEHSDANLLQQERTGEKYKLAYQYTYNPWNTSFNFSAQYQDLEYLTLNNAMSFGHLNDLDQAEIDNFFQTYQLKQQYNISLYQTFADSWLGSIYFNVSRNTYWNTNKNYMQYNISYANNWKRLGYSIGYAQTDNRFSNEEKEHKVYLTLTLPLNWREKRANLYSNIQHSDLLGNPTTASVGFTGTLGDNNQMSYGLTTNQNWYDSDHNSSVSANVSYRLPQVQLGAVTGWSDHQNQYGFSARGALVAHPYGVTATNNLSDTFTIIHADDAKGADIVNAWGAKIDRFGNAIYPNISPYEVNQVALDVKKLPFDISLNANQADVIPRRYSSTLVKFDTKKTSNVLLNVHVLGNEKQIPIGIQATNAAGDVIGMFGQSNQLFVEKDELLKDSLYVRWGTNNDVSCQIEAPEHLIQEKSKKLQLIDVECK